MNLFLSSPPWTDMYAKQLVICVNGFLQKISQLVFQIARLKEALSGRRRVPVLRTSSSFSSFLDRL